MASVILAQEVNPAVGAAAAGLTVIAAGMSFACTRYAHCPLRRLVGRRSRPLPRLTRLTDAGRHTPTGNYGN